MYKIIANRRLRSAVLQKEDGTLWFSWGPDMVPSPAIREEYLDQVRPTELPNLTKYYVHHEPPIEIEKLEDWPNAVQEVCLSKRSPA